jgi:RNA polymerase sigma-70 factor (ECF subfamily)
MAVGEHGSGDGELVLAARRGELGAFDELVRRYQRKATAVAFRLLNNRDDAMEVVQDAFLNAYDRLASLDEPDRFGPWLLRIVGNLALNRRRSRSLRKTVSLEGPWQDDEDRGELNRPDPRDQTPLEIASGRELKQLIARAIDELPELQRQALVLFSMQNLPQKQVADMLGCSVEAVKWHVFTARKKLKERFKDYL